MTKKTALQLIATVALAAGFIGVSGVSANAATTADSVSENTQTTQATVGLTAGTTDPDGPHSGQISLTSAPDIDFGSTNTIKPGLLSLNGTFGKSDASTDKTANANSVTVNNPGVTDTWNVNVSASAFKNTDPNVTDSAANAQLIGAQIDFEGALGTTNAAGVGKNPAIANQAFTLDASGAATSQSVLHADINGYGVGTWTNDFSKATLQVPAGQVAGTYASTLTWTISNTPAATTQS